MSVQSALSFIQAVSEDVELQGRLRALGPDPSPDELVALGAEAGFEFSSSELRAAFARDWAMRRAFYAGVDD